MLLSLCINVIWDLIRNDKYISIHVSCCKVSLLISSTSTSLFVSGIRNVNFLAKWPLRIHPLNVSSQPNTCSCLSPPTARCARSPVSPTMAYLHWVTYMHARTQDNAHSLLLRGLWHFSTRQTPKLPLGSTKATQQKQTHNFSLHVDQTLERLLLISALRGTGLAEWMCFLHSAGDLTAVSLRCGSFVSSLVFKLYKTYLLNHMRLFNNC